jgi:hypothetical protein
MTIQILAAITALSTLVYGVATWLLWRESREDRKQRQQQFIDDANRRRVSDLQSAFYEAWGYWEGHFMSVGSVAIDASQVGRQFEALIRLECQLRLNGYNTEANDLGYAARTDFGEIRKQIGAVGVAIGLIPSQYRRVNAV